MTTLYIKTHKITGLKYFGKTTFDPFSYNGSGKHWKDHLKIHGKDIHTEVYAEFEDDDIMLVETALKFSEDNNIVKSKDWANQILENGLDGCPKGTKRSDETKKKIGEASKGRQWSEESKDKMRGNNHFLGKIHSEETKAKMSKAHTGKTLSKEHKKKIGDGCRGSKRTEETKAKMSEWQKGKPKKKVKCPHCELIGGGSNMTRYHFDKCKMNPENFR